MYGWNNEEINKLRSWSSCSIYGKW